MITKYKVPCEHCGKETFLELDQNIHQVNERLLLLDKKIATLWKAVAENNNYSMAVLEQIEQQNQLLKEYHTNPAVLDKITGSCKRFMVKCEKCNFKETGLINELPMDGCPSCKGVLDLHQITESPISPEGK